MTSVFVTGGTGYLGRPLIAALLARGLDVHALVRPGSEARLPAGVNAIVGNALDETTFQRLTAGGSSRFRTSPPRLPGRFRSHRGAWSSRRHGLQTSACPPPPIAMMLSMPSGLILIGWVFALGIVRWRTPSRTAVQ